jgi:glycerate kinase
VNILIAPDKFKGTLTAMEAARSIRRGLRAALPTARVRMVPLADGGEGFASALVRATEGRMVRVRGIRDARGRVGESSYGWLGDGTTAVIELARVAGITPLPVRLRNPSVTTTYGVGQLMRHAAERGAGRIIVGLGGSATNDGGAGLAAALGYRFLDRSGRELPLGGAALARLHTLERPADLRLPPVVAAVDVNHVLLGRQGASAVFGPQKGATPAMVRELDRALARLARIARSGVETQPGSGAAGGAAYGLATFAGARFEPGFEIVARVCGLARLVDWADWVVTGEGSLDAQTAGGKGPERLRALAEGRGRRVLALAGRVEDPGRFANAFGLVPGWCGIKEAMDRPAFWLERMARDCGRMMRGTD